MTDHQNANGSSSSSSSDSRRAAPYPPAETRSLSPSLSGTQGSTVQEDGAQTLSSLFGLFSISPRGPDLVGEESSITNVGGNLGVGWTVLKNDELPDDMGHMFIPFAASTTSSYPQHRRRTTKSTKTKASSGDDLRSTIAFVSQISIDTEREKELKEGKEEPQKEKKSKKRVRKKKGEARAQGSPSPYQPQRPLTSRYAFNPETGHTMDTMEDQDWSLCDKDCGWCGHCAEAYDI